MDEQQNTEPAEGKPPENNPQIKPGFWKQTPVIFIGTAVVAVILYFGLRHLVLSFTHESTDNAFLESDVVAIAPKISGQVKTVFVNDNQIVRAGDPLVEIDPRDYDVILAQKQSALAASKANEDLVRASYELLKIQVTSAQATANQSEAAAAADRAKSEKASADLKRAEDLIEQKIISPQEYDAARSESVSAAATLNSSQAKAEADRAKVLEARAQAEAGRRGTQRAEAQAEQSGVDVRQAELNLSYARIVAPADGRVTRKAVEPGDYMQAGQKLMALVLNDLWVTANFKETQLQHIRTNQAVAITVDSVSGRKFSGRVDSIQAGSGAAFSLLPPENAVGNYVKVVQRVPVKIVFDEPLEVEHVLGPGMSVVPSVRTADFEVPDVVTGIVAAVLAMGVGIVWLKMARRPAPPETRPR